jgi:hypothetical protein
MSALPASTPGAAPALVGIRSEDVNSQLEKISRSEGFRKSERLRRFLQFTVDLTLRGDVWQLREHVIAREVFDRSAGFDPRVESIVRVEAKRLRRKLSEYYNSIGANDTVLIEFRTGSYVPDIRENQLRAMHRPRTADLTYGAPDAAAHARYLQAARELNTAASRQAKSATVTLQALTAEHPRYALAQAALAGAHLNQVFHGTAQPQQAFAAARAAALKSRELDGNLPHAHAAMAEVFLYGEWKWEAAIDSANRAIELMPHCVSAHVTRGLALTAAGRAPEGLAGIQRAVELAPLSVRANQALAFCYEANGNPAAASGWYAAAESLSPNGFTQLLWALHSLGQKRPGDALQHVRECQETSLPIALGIQGACAAHAGDRKSAQKQLTRLAEMQDDLYSDPMATGLIHQALREDPQASARFRSSVEQHSPLVLLTSLGPLLRDSLPKFF